MGNKYLSMIAAAEAPEPTQSTPITPPDPNDYRETVVETHLRLDRLAVPQSASDLRAKELIKLCREYGVGLKLDPDGTLVVVSNGAAWRSLVRDIEQHIDAVAELIAAGWDPTDA